MRNILFFSLFLLPFVMQAQEGGTDYRIYDTRLKKEVTVADITASVKPGEVLVFGEQHDDSIGHILEAAVLRSLHQRMGGRTVLAMEMFHRDVQYILDEYLAGVISEKNFIKEARAWDTYKTDYRPAVEFAKAKGLKVIAANTPSRYTNLVTRKGLAGLDVLGKEVKKNYLPPLPVDTMTGAYYNNFLEAMGGHTAPGMHLFQSQNLWDATMAWSIAQTLKKDRDQVVFMMNGRFHSDRHLGFVSRLEKEYRKTVVTISSFAVAGLDTASWEQYADLADFVILTRGKPEQD